MIVVSEVKYAERIYRRPATGSAATMVYVVRRRVESAATNAGATTGNTRAEETNARQIPSRTKG